MIKWLFYSFQEEIKGILIKKFIHRPKSYQYSTFFHCFSQNLRWLLNRSFHEITIFSLNEGSEAAVPETAWGWCGDPTSNPHCLDAVLTQRWALAEVLRVKRKTVGTVSKLREFLCTLLSKSHIFMELLWFMQRDLEGESLLWHFFLSLHFRNISLEVCLETNLGPLSIFYSIINLPFVK